MRITCFRNARHTNRVGGKRSGFLPTFVFRPLTPPYLWFRIQRFLILRAIWHSSPSNKDSRSAPSWDWRRPPPDINGPPPYQKDASRWLSATCGRLSFFYETLSVQSWPEASGRHFDVKNLWLWLQVFQPNTVSTGIGRLCGWRCFAKWCSVKWCFVKYWQGAGKKYYYCPLKLFDSTKN